MTTPSENHQTTLLTWIRSFIFYIYLGLSIPPTGLISYLLRLCSNTLPWKFIRVWGHSINKALYLICGVKTLSIGEFPDTTEPFLIVANHTGPWETIAFMSLCPRDASYVLKKNLLQWHYTFFALGSKSLDPVPISRTANAGDFKLMLQEIPKRFANNHPVIIFPQGTRAPIGEALQMSPGGSVLAKKLKCGLLPIFINSEAWGRGTLVKDFGLVRPGTIQIVIGDYQSAESIRAGKVTTSHEAIMKLFKEHMPSS